MFIFTNPNPHGKIVGDCTVRALSILFNRPWNDVYKDLCETGYLLKDMPAANEVFNRYLRERGYVRSSLPNECPDCYSLYDFCVEHPRGRYIAGTGTHVVAIIDGDYYDTWDSGREVLLYYYRR